MSSLKAFILLSEEMACDKNSLGNFEDIISH
jgi:hypothetical protein